MAKRLRSLVLSLARSVSDGSICERKRVRRLNLLFLYEEIFLTYDRNSLTVNDNLIGDSIYDD